MATGMPYSGKPTRVPWHLGKTEATCIKCLTVRPIEEFVPKYVKGKDYRERACRSCRNNYNLQLRHKRLLSSPIKLRPCKICGKSVSVYQRSICEECRYTAKPCSECGEVKDAENYGFNRSGVFDNLCRTCRNLKNLSRRRARIEAGLCTGCGSRDQISGRMCEKCLDKERNSTRSIKISNKLKAIEYLGGKCLDCGLSTELHCVYDFHHRDPSTKEFEINSGKKLEWDRIVIELDKCDLLCSNCHRIRHHKMRNGG